MYLDTKCAANTCRVHYHLSQKGLVLDRVVNIDRGNTILLTEEMVKLFTDHILDLLR